MPVEEKFLVLVTFWNGSINLKPFDKFVCFWWSFLFFYYEKKQLPVGNYQRVPELTQFAFAHQYVFRMTRVMLCSDRSPCLDRISKLSGKVTTFILLRIIFLNYFHTIYPESSDFLVHPVWFFEFSVRYFCSLVRSLPFQKVLHCQLNHFFQSGKILWLLTLKAPITTCRGHFQSMF